MLAVGPVSQFQPHVLILGTRGIPAAHGGFESFAEKLALFLVARGWRVTVYCQKDVAGAAERFTKDMWQGIERVHHRFRTLRVGLEDRFVRERIRQ